MTYLEALSGALRAHGFTSFSLGSVQGADMQPLGQAFDVAQQALYKQIADPDWEGIASQLRALEPTEIKTLSFHCHEASTFAFVFARVGQGPIDFNRTHKLVESMGLWVQGIRERMSTYQLSDPLQQKIRDLSGEISSNPLLGSAVDLILSAHRFHGRVRAVVVDVFSNLTEESRKTFGATDLTVSASAGQIWVQAWSWEIDNNVCTRGGLGTWDGAYGETFLPEIKTAANLENTMDQYWRPKA